MLITLDQTNPLQANAGLQQNTVTIQTVNQTTNPSTPSVATPTGTFTTSSSLTPGTFSSLTAGTAGGTTGIAGWQWLALAVFLWYFVLD